MLFTSLEFFLLMALVVPCSVLLARRPNVQNAFLLLVSYLFYGWWDWRFLGLIVLSTFVDYFASNAIFKASAARVKKRWLQLSLIVNLGLLLVFKYFDFFSLSLLDLTKSLGLAYDPILLDVLLPVGISFYTFQTMSYTIDVYRGKSQPCTNPLSFALFVSFFPQLVAGPIERVNDLLPQLEGSKRPSFKQFEEGLFLITYGLFLKVVVADGVAPVANIAFANPNYPWFPLLVGVMAFSVQIYGDFCGYSMIARGAARFLGVDLSRNFRTPYFSTNIQEFWRRWHVSLSQWLRDYLYISLGGNRKGPVRTYVNLAITMLLGGLWHGAGWNFVIWGGLHGAALSVHRRFVGAKKSAQSGGFASTFLKVAALYLFICLTWVFFRASTLSDAQLMLEGIFTLRGGLTLSGTMGALKVVLVCLAVLPFEVYFYRSDEEIGATTIDWRVQAVFFSIAWICITGGLDTNASFIYFQF